MSSADTMREKGTAWIGTSNVVIPGNKTTFPPEYQSKSRLCYYSSLFNSVEINRSFYKSPLRSTYEKWSLGVAKEFRFSLKLSKEITHAKTLVAELSLISNFLASAQGIGEKKGCLLVQFPGKISLQHFTQVELILQQLSQANQGQQWKIAVEFREPSWYTGETWEMLDALNASVVLHDIPKAKLLERQGKADFVYLRLHGEKGDYRGTYSDKFLKAQAERIKKWTKDGLDVYVYFNNTIGEAFENALNLKKLCDFFSPHRRT